MHSQIHYEVMEHTFLGDDKLPLILLFYLTA